LKISEKIVQILFLLRHVRSLWGVQIDSIDSSLL